MFIEDEITSDNLATEVTADQLWLSYLKERTMINRNRLVLFYAPLVRLVGNRISKGMRSFQSIEEICSSGQLGLIDAVEKYDPTDGFKFSTYATIRIQGAIIDQLRQEDILPKRMRARVRTYQVARETLEMDLHRTPTIREIADHLDTSIEEILQIDDMAVSSSYLIPLSMINDDKILSSASMAIDPSEASDLASMKTMIKAALLRLTERQRQVLVLHYLEGFQKSEIADTLEIDRSRVTQLIHQGLKNLRIELEKQNQITHN